MGGLHAYYMKGDVKVGLVCECNVVSKCFIQGGSCDPKECREYVTSGEDDDQAAHAMMVAMCDEYERLGYVEAEWMFGNEHFWDEFYACPDVKVEYM